MQEKREKIGNQPYNYFSDKRSHKININSINADIFTASFTASIQAFLSAKTFKISLTKKQLKRKR